ncbi:MAG TPA: hypothetical protein DDW76_15060 [Cyanobacteria bacterium UBA11369]|nr:hypothetical protein [Cyanobacteria bacterium UBA11371]HBE33165.1 hypothetical protein [Cyanobacteria bacterium UBA11368]HBE50077.1 hypothetical protein [Cyanobacteria bacterium UBA11369]
MKNFEQVPLLESTLTNLLNKTQKDWGYCQIKKKDNVYTLHLVGTDEAMLTVAYDSGHIYKLYWYANSTPDVSVQNKLNKIYNKPTRTYTKQRIYQVSYQHHSNPLRFSINQMFAELVKAKIIEDTSKQTKEDEKPPLVTVVQD